MGGTVAALAGRMRGRAALRFTGIRPGRTGR